MPKLDLHHFTLHYESIRVEESSSDHIIIFLHEALGSLPQWRNFPEECCKTVQLNGIVYERQGHGNSSEFSQKRKADYLHRYAWDELPLLIDSLIPQERKVILVGHSDGGSIALLYASRYPKRVAMCISMAAHVINEPETIAGIEPAVVAFEQGKLEKLRQFHSSKTNDLFYAWSDIWRHHSFLNWNICDEISLITSPVLAIQGRNDQYGTIKQLELIRSSIKGACQIEMVDNCGHHPHLEKSSEIIQLISKFVNIYS